MTLGIQLNEIKHVLLADRWHEVEPESFALDAYEFMEGAQAVARGDGQLITTVGFMFREHGFVIAVRGGGHSVAGFSTCDGGVVIGLSGMRAVEIDPVSGSRECREARCSSTSTALRRSTDSRVRSASSVTPGSRGSR